MGMGGRSVVGLLVLMSSASALGFWPDKGQAVTRVAFGGCNFQRMPQTHWRTIESLAPQFWIWNGDAIYADHMALREREQEFQKLKTNKHYAQFIQNVPVIGVWDDHDFGPDGANASIDHKAERQKMYLDFVDEPADSPRWSRNGIYGSWTLGPVGKRLKVVLLDVRYFREEPSKKATILGDLQKRWFEDELKASDYELLMVVSGSQMIPDEDDADLWADYPRDRADLVDLLNEATAPVILMSGDRHFAEISQIKTKSGAQVFEITTSGLTHSTFLKNSKNSHRVGKWYTKRNFGWMDVDWSAPTPKGSQFKSATLKVMDLTGKVVLSQRVGTP